MAANLLGSLGLFCLFFLQVFLPILLRPFQVHQLQLLSHSHICYTAFLILWQDYSIHLSFFYLPFSLCTLLKWQSPLDSKFCFCFCFFFLLIIIWSGLLAGNWWSVCISKSHWILCVSFSRTDFCLCIYHLVTWWKFHFLYNSKWIALPTQSCLVLYSCASLLH